MTYINSKGERFEQLSTMLPEDLYVRCKSVMGKRRSEYLRRFLEATVYPGGRDYDIAELERLYTEIARKAESADMREAVQNGGSP